MWTQGSRTRVLSGGGVGAGFRMLTTERHWEGWEGGGAGSDNKDETSSYVDGFPVNLIQNEQPHSAVCLSLGIISWKASREAFSSRSHGN